MHYSFDDYHDCLNQSFTLFDGDNNHQIELIEVTRLYDGKDGRAPASFSIVFRGDKAVLLPQRIYHMQNETMGEIDIFIVPIGPDDTGMRYEAIFTS